MIRHPWPFRQRSKHNIFFKRCVLASGMLSSNQDDLFDEIADSRRTWQLPIALHQSYPLRCPWQVVGTSCAVLELPSMTPGRWSAMSAVRLQCLRYYHSARELFNERAEFFFVAFDGTRLGKKDVLQIALISPDTGKAVF